MSFYQELGFLALGSRLRRISEAFLLAVGKAYQQEGIEFEASWFPIFYLLDQNKQLSQRELGERIEVSYAAISQLISLLKQKGYVVSAPNPNDGRKQFISLSEKGLLLLAQVKPIWGQINQAMDDMLINVPNHEGILPAIELLETAFQSDKLIQLITNEKTPA
ncbi:MarR family winged helix-turn-helix transcriptional regulator [Pedobacter sp. MW01-1-1]|uniref:MarR family winged helix-turn-helix transcriptional regulator n=1 Tax=Pedobacter sp. MW01-1-1 TaxID=3383027 RepID=UPI003FEDF909